MVAFNMLWKLSVLLAFGLSSTVTSTDEAQEQPTQEELDSGCLRKNNEPATEPVAELEPTNIDATGCTETEDSLRFSVKWLLLPKAENRTALRHLLPRSLARRVPEDCNEPIAPLLEKDIKKHLSLYTVGWYLLPKPESRAALRHLLPKDLATTVPENCNEPIDPEVEQDIKKFFSFSAQKQRFLRLHSYFHGI